MDIQKLRFSFLLPFFQPLLTDRCVLHSNQTLSSPCILLPFGLWCTVFLCCGSKCCPSVRVQLALVFYHAPIRNRKDQVLLVFLLSVQNTSPLAPKMCGYLFSISLPFFVFSPLHLRPLTLFLIVLPM